MNRQKAKSGWFARYKWMVFGPVVAIALLGVGVGWSLNRQSQNEGGKNPPSAAPVVLTSAAKEMSQGVEVVRVGRESAATMTTYPGTVKAAETAALAFRVGGPLIEVKIKPGDYVHRKDILMRIDPRDFQNAHDGAKATLDAARAKLAAMKAGARAEDIRMLEAKIDAATARRDYLKAVFQRNTRLLQSNAVSRTEFDASQSELTASEADLRSLKQEYEKATVGARREDIEAMEADIRGMETQLKIASDRLDDTVLRAPFDGFITRQLAENFEQVAPGQTVVTMHDVSNLEIDVALPEKEIVRRCLKAPFHAEVRLVALPGKSFPAEFKEIKTEADPATRTYLVTFVMPASSGVNVLPGMVADVTLQSHAQGAERGPAVTVPAVAVQNDGNGCQFVWAIEGNTVRKQRIKVGSLLRGNQYEVLDGVRPGEVIVTAGASFLHDGAEVFITRTAAQPQQNDLSKNGPPRAVQ